MLTGGVDTAVVKSSHGMPPYVGITRTGSAVDDAVESSSQPAIVRAPALRIHMMSRCGPTSVPIRTPRPCGREHHNHAKAGHVQCPQGQKSVSGAPVSGSGHGSSRSGRLFLMLLTSVETASTAKRDTGVSFIRRDSSSSSVLG